MRGIIWYLVLTFGLAWGSWELVIHSRLASQNLLSQLYFLPGSCAPAAAAFLVRAYVTREGFADAGLRLNLKKWPYYAFSLFVPIVVVAAILWQAGYFGIAEPDFTLARAMRSDSHIALLAGAAAKNWLIVLQAFTEAIVFTPLLFGEEFGWRGYLQPRLFGGKRPIAASVITGVIWAVWHYPLILSGWVYHGHPVLGMLAYIPLAIASSWIFFWVQQKTGSVWAASFAHSATDAFGPLSTLWLAGAASPILINYAGVLAIPPLLVICLAIFFFGGMRKAAGSSQPGSSAPQETR